MKEITWNPLKNERLKKTRGVSFEEIIKAKLIVVENHPVLKHQKILIYEHKGYLWAVPYVIDGEKVFLKTIYPSRKLMRIYKREPFNENEKN